MEQHGRTAAAAAHAYRPILKQLLQSEGLSDQVLQELGSVRPVVCSLSRMRRQQWKQLDERHADLGLVIQPQARHAWSSINTRSGVRSLQRSVLGECAQVFQQLVTLIRKRRGRSVIFL